MSGTTIGTIDTLLESVEESVDDPDLGFTLRTARQLLLVNYPTLLRSPHTGFAR